MEERANARLESKLANDDYDSSQLISVEIPGIDYLPYANNIRDFKKLKGLIEIEGIQYNYVKWRLYDDTLEFLCMPNPTVTKLQNAKIDFFKLVNDLQNGGQNKKSAPSPNTSKKILSEYYIATEFSGFINPYFTISKQSVQLSADIPTNFPSSIDYPPEQFWFFLKTFS